MDYFPVTILSMKRTVLLSPGNSAIGKLLTHFSVSQGDNVIALQEESGGTKREIKKKNKEDEKDGVLRIPYNWHSPLSASQVRIDGVNRFGGIDEVILILEVGGENKPLQAFSPSEVEKKIDRGIKGTLFLIREVIGLFQKRRSGLISIVLYQEMESLRPPLDLVVRGGLYGLTESLFTVYQNEEFKINGFDLKSISSEEAADFIWKIHREKGIQGRGKWYRMSDKQGFIQTIMNR